MRRCIQAFLITTVMATVAEAQVTTAPASRDTPTSVAGAATMPGKQPTHMPTFNDIEREMEAGSYREALRDVARVIPQSSTADSIYDRFDLMMVQGECQLQLRLSAAAIDTYRAAQQYALKALDFRRIALPTAMLELIKNSSVYQYRVKTGLDAAKNIPILDRAQRQAAFTALLGDTLASVRRRVDGLALETSLTPIVQTSEFVGIEHDVEYAISAPLNSSIPARTLVTMTPQTDPLAVAVVKATQGVINHYTDVTREVVESIAQYANVIVTSYQQNYNGFSKQGYVTPINTRQGLSNDQASALRADQKELEGAKAAIVQIGKNLRTNFSTLQGIVTKITTTKIRVDAVLNDNYSAPVGGPTNIGSVPTGAAGLPTGGTPMGGTTGSTHH